MKRLRLALNGLAMLLTVLYPVAVYFGSQAFEPRYLALLLFATILLRQWQATRRFAATMRWPEWVAFAGLCALALTIMATNEARLLLYYPAIVSASMLILFARTLVRPPSMIERFARLSTPDLSSAGVCYTRKVTFVWCGFFVLNTCVSLATTSLSRESWVLYNGFISYLLMGLLFSIEWIVRSRVQARLA